MAQQPATRVATNDLEEIAPLVAGIYCDHSIQTLDGARAHAAGFDLVRQGPQPIVQLHYGRSVRIDAGTFPRLMLVQTCLDGSGSAEQGAISTELRRGQTVPLSPGVATQLAFDGRFSQRSVRLDIESVEALCKRWLNVPALDRPLRFALHPFSASLEQAWAQAVNLIVGYARSGIPLPVSAVANLDEFLVSLVLSQHPHNYSDDLRRPQKPPSPRLVREAERLMQDGSPELTPSRIAAELGVSLRTLEMGFRATHDCTPNAFLRKVRITRAREALLAADACTSVTDVALACGFLHLARFSAHYRQMFGELPVQTLRRCQPRSMPARNA